MSTSTHFTAATFAFIRDLRANNDRDWFQANKHRYEEHVKEPARRFIVDFGAHLGRISPHFLADPRPQGGALFRIYRDIRFSKNKDPYKDHVGLYFRHAEGKSVHLPGFYLHLEPRASFVGLGSWRPQTAELQLIRQAVARHPEKWRAAVEQPPFSQSFQVVGESLKRPPRGFAQDHPLVDVLKLKDFTGLAPLTQKQITSPGFVEEFAAYCASGSPLVRFLCEALGQPF